MEIAPALLDDFNALNEEQKEIVRHKQGPLLVVAGPGSGKTYSLTLLAMNLLLCGDAEPAQIVLCTYTEKAAHELQDRITALADKVGYMGDVSQLRVGTIHGICRRLLHTYLHHTHFGHDYEMLDQFTQPLLIFRNLEKICPADTLHVFLRSWDTPWKVAKKLQFYFNTITEELIFESLKKSFPDRQACKSFKDELVFSILHAYNRYRSLLVETNSIDFAYMQKCTYNLLIDPEVSPRITRDIRYVLVDEYQDTNYIQEKILTLLAAGCDPKNFIAIGDEDQALYRFRGATVRNILTFANNFTECKKTLLTTNYRSHPGIIDTYNQWIKNFNWSNPGGDLIRTEKKISANPAREDATYPATVTLESIDAYDEAEKFADLVDMLKRQEKINDYSEVALLLRSVRYTGDPYIEALEKKGIPAHYPRARRFFKQEEIRLLIGCFARLLKRPTGRDTLPDEERDFAKAVVECLIALEETCSVYPELEEELQLIVEEILLAEEESERERYLADYFYRLIFLAPFSGFLQDEKQRANLVLFSGLLRTFQKYYTYRSITPKQLLDISNDFFEGFLSFLFSEGLNEDEDQHQALVKGRVQIMTIYQAKGLEFPVVVVGGLDDAPSYPNRERRDFQQYYYRPYFEPEQLIRGCDHKRLYYVAFSRAKSLLVLTAKRQPDRSFTALWQNTPALEYLNESLLDLPALGKSNTDITPKPRYGFTTHIQTYQTCPRRYQFFHEQRFAPSRRSDAFFGQLVHQTIELVHRFVLDGELDLLDEQRLQALFARIYTFWRRTHKRSLTETEQEQAFHHVYNYVLHNQRKMKALRDAEYPVQITHTDYVLNGKIDVLLQTAEGLEVLDFKTQARLERTSPRFLAYQQQLYLYAYALSKNLQSYPQRLSLYWTAEEQLEDALMDIPCNQAVVEQAVDSVHEIIMQIQQQQFAVKVPPDASICQTCDVRRLCKKEKIIN